MTAMDIPTCTVEEAVKILHGYGLNFGVQRLYEGIQCGIYDFGEYIPMGRGVYTVYVVLLEKWISKRVREVEVPNIPKLKEEE